jgi:hypothetical protein
VALPHGAYIEKSDNFSELYIKYYYTEAGSAPPRMVSPAMTFFTSSRSKVSYSNRASASYTRVSQGHLRSESGTHT